MHVDPPWGLELQKADTMKKKDAATQLRGYANAVSFAIFAIFVHSNVLPSIDFKRQLVHLCSVANFEYFEY